MIPARPLYQGGCGSVPHGRTESGGIVLAANAGPRVPRGGVTLKRRCTHRPSVIYFIVNKLFSLSLSLSPPPSLSPTKLDTTRLSSCLQLLQCSAFTGTTALARLQSAKLSDPTVLCVFITAIPITKLVLRLGVPQTLLDGSWSFRVSSFF